MSLTYVSFSVVVLTYILPKLGVNITADALSSTITTIVQIVAGILVFYGRYRAGGVTALGLRK